MVPRYQRRGAELLLQAGVHLDGRHIVDRGYFLLLRSVRPLTDLVGTSAGTSMPWTTACGGWGRHPPFTLHWDSIDRDEGAFG